MKNELLNQEKDNIWLDLIDRVVTVVTTLLIILLAFTIISYAFFRPFVIEGESMQPTISDEATVLVTSTGGTASRGDIVIIDILYDDNFSVAGKQQFIIKRVVAVGGDKVGFVYNQDKSRYYLYIDKGNGWVKQDEPYEMTRVSDLFSGISVCNDESGLDANHLTIGQGKIFALGDNRDVSADSRKFGQFSLESIKGKYIYTLQKNGILEFLFSLIFNGESSSN